MKRMKRVLAMILVVMMLTSAACVNAFGLVAMAEPVETVQVKNNPGTGDNSILPWAIGGGVVAVGAAVAAVVLGKKKK